MEGMNIPEIKTISFIGASNVAYHYARSFVNSRLTINQVWSRNPDSAKSLADECDASYVSDINEIKDTSDLIIVSVPDKAIRDLIGSFSGKNYNFVVHTSGSMDIDILSPISQNFGSFYPLQTISKEVSLDFQSVPILVEANSKNYQKSLFNLGKHISLNVSEMNSEMRRVIHLVAVIVSNFSNLFYDIGYEIAEKYGLPFDLVKPLITQTAKKIENVPPAKVQTGPAKRGDIEIIEKHTALLKSVNPEYANMYKLLSEMIIKRKQNEK